MSGRYGGNIKGKRVNRNGPSSGQRKAKVKDWNTAFGSLIPNVFQVRPMPEKMHDIDLGKISKESVADA